MSALKEKPVHIKTLFDYLDTNNDGVLSFSEAKVALEAAVERHELRTEFNTLAEAVAFLEEDIEAVLGD